jgi:dienelactone hydrolase
MTPINPMRIAYGLVLALGLGGCAQPLFPALSDIDLTWANAVVVLPALSEDDVLVSTMNSPEMNDRLAMLADGEALPIAVYMHGCTGIGGLKFLEKLADEGFAVIAPNSFARSFRPLQCDPETKSGGFNLFVYDFRMAEISFALEKLWYAEWADWSRMVLAGVSEGAVAVALYRGDEFNARVIAQWTCNGAPLVAGIDAPLDEPILAVVGADDPWYANLAEGEERVDCSKYFDGRPGSRAEIIYKSEAHDVFENAAMVEAMVYFLTAAVDL